MGTPVTPFHMAKFADPEEDIVVTVDRLVMAASYWKISDSALRSLIHLTALACESRKVVALTMPTADLDELIRRGLVRTDPDQSGLVVLI